MGSTATVKTLNNGNEFDNCTEDKVYVYETAINAEYIKQEPYDTEDEPGNIQNYVLIKEGIMQDPTVAAQETKLTTECTDNNIYINEIISIKDEIIEDPKILIQERMNGGYIKQEPCNSKDQRGNVHNYVNMIEETIENSTVVVQETRHMTNIKKDCLTWCEGCGEEYDLYCLKCPMLIRILDSNNLDLNDDGVRRTVPKNFVDICKTQSGVGIVALRVIPKGVVFGPFRGLDSTTDGAVSKWMSRNKEPVCSKNRKSLNWMRYIQRVDHSSDPNLTPFQYKDGLYYRSDSHIAMGDELLVCWDSDGEVTATQDGYLRPQICESLDDAYACTLCCVGYKSISHLEAHSSRCPEKRDQNDSCKEIIQCAFCKIYVNEKEYSSYHVDQCFERNTKISAVRRGKKQNQKRAVGRPRKYFKPFACTLCPYKPKTNTLLKLHMVTHSDDKPFACSLCPYKAKSKSNLRGHVTIHTDNKPIACSRCPYKTRTNAQLKLHNANHHDDKPFACSLCSYRTKTDSKLQTHIASHSEDKPFACSVCSYKTKTAYSLKRHLISHNDDKPFACALCPYKTKKNKNLKRHVVIHDDDKSFACSLCTYKTKKNTNLKRHLAVHNDDKSFACVLCSYKTKTKFLLKRHVAIHNDDQPFACAQCSYVTSTNWQLKQHIASHSDDKPFKCDVCPKMFKRKSILTKHVQTVHSNAGKRKYKCSQVRSKLTT